MPFGGAWKSTKKRKYIRIFKNLKFSNSLLISAFAKNIGPEQISERSTAVAGAVSIHSISGYIILITGFQSEDFIRLNNTPEKTRKI